MNDDFELMTLLADEYIQARLEEAEARRLLRQASQPGRLLAATRWPSWVAAVVILLAVALFTLTN